MAMIPKPSEELFVGMELTIGPKKRNGNGGVSYFDARVWWFDMVGIEGGGKSFTADQKNTVREYRNWLQYWNEYCNWCRYKQKRGTPKWQ